MNDERQDPIAGGFQSRADFEAALPLFVGGDLTPEEARRVELWAEEHPEDAGRSSPPRRLTNSSWPTPRRLVRSRAPICGRRSGRSCARRDSSGPATWSRRSCARLDRGTRAERSPPRRLVLCGGLAGLLALGGGSEQVGDPGNGASVTFTGTEGRPAAVRFANATLLPPSGRRRGLLCVRPGARPSTSSSGLFRFPVAR